jgi:Ca-activated chloride channel family protein
MPRRLLIGAAWAVGLIWLAVVSLSGQTSKSQGGQRIFVVAVHDSSLFTLCPSTKFPVFQLPDGRVHLQNPVLGPVTLPPARLVLGPGMLDMERPDWPGFAPGMPEISPSGWIDLNLESKIKNEFEKHKEYVLADSVGDADLVFLIEGLYLSLLTVKRGANTANLVSYGKTNTGDRYVLSAMAIVMPADAYRANPGDVDALLQARLWDGSTFMSRYAGGFRSAPVETLVQQFVKKKKNPDSLPPVCAAWSMSGLSYSRAETGKKSVSIKPAEAGLVLPPGEPTRAAAGTIKVNVTLVTVPVIASDADGRYVSDLTARDFHLFENGSEQPIDRVVPEVEPFHVALLLDVSGSTTLKHGDIQSAALAFLESMRSEDQVMVSSFSAAIHVDSEFTSDRDRLNRAILLTNVGTSTRLYDALELVVTQRLNEIQGRKAIVLLTDGMDTASRLSDLNMSLARMEESDVLVYVLQYDTRKDLPILSQSVAPSYARASEYLRDLSVNSGGRRFDASSVPALRDAFAQISEELRHQYALCYYPALQATDSSFRRIQVTVDRPGVRVRARVGYRPTVRH